MNSAQQNEKQTRSRFWKRMLWISAALILVPSVFGLFDTIAGMIGAMDTMGLEGGSDPKKLAENISLVVMTTTGGLVVSILALPVFVVSLRKHHSRTSQR